MKKTTWGVIGKGLAGWHAQSADGNTSSTSYDRRPEQAAEYARDAVDGALVYDASEADVDALTDHVFKGPMCNPSLPPDGYRRFMDRETARMMLPGLSGAFKAYAEAAQNPQFSGLDYVGTGIFESLLRKIPGIKIGKVLNGKIAWEA